MGIGLCATVLVPWLLGRYVLRDTFLLPTRTTAPSEVRNFLRGSLGSYFLSDYLSGVCVIAAIAAILCLVRPWRGRPVGIILSLAMLVGCWFAHGQAINRWDANEAIVNASVIYPFPESDSNGKYYQTCGLADAVNGTDARLNDKKYATGGFSGGYVTFAGQHYYVWTAHYSPSSGDDSPSGTCNRIYAYQGWQVFKRLDVGSQGVNGGSICDTDGTVDGLIWFVDSANQTNATPDDADGFFYWRVADASATSLTFLAKADFAQQFPNCTA